VGVERSGRESGCTLQETGGPFYLVSQENWKGGKMRKYIKGGKGRDMGRVITPNRKQGVTKKKGAKKEACHRRYQTLVIPVCAKR